MTRTKIILGVLFLAVIIPTASAVVLPSTLFDEPCGGSPAITQICEGVNLLNDEVEAQILRLDSLNSTAISLNIDILAAESDQDIINATAVNNDERLDDILFNSTGINATSFIEVDDDQIVQDINISNLESSVTTLQSQTATIENTHEVDLAAIHEHVDVVNRNIASGPLPVPQLETDYTAICNDGSQTKIVDSGVGTLTNGVNTTSNIPELIVGTIGGNVTVNYTDTRLTFKMTVTNPDDITGLTGEAFLTCVTYPN